MKAISISSLLVIVVPILFSGWGCTNLNNVSFNGSECKSEEEEKSPTARLYTMPDSVPYQGMECVSWKTTSEGQFVIDLINFSGACGANYTGEAHYDNDGTLSLDIINPQCEIANCGWCIYDWSFELESIHVEDNLDITITEDPCPGNEGDSTTRQLQISQNDLLDGIVCRFHHVDLFVLKGCGGLHQPCFNLEPSDSEDSLCGVRQNQCDEGLTCVDGEHMAQPTCVQTCDQTQNCPLEPLLSCQQGKCLLAQSW